MKDTRIEEDLAVVLRYIIASIDAKNQLQTFEIKKMRTR
jgi:hypothetical protein